MNLELLPVRTAGAAENMAMDFLLLQRYPRAPAPRFRHYEWRAPAFTFGYSQKIAFVRAQLPPGETFDLCRRPTGGGVVDHRDDWTYALVIPRGHPFEEARAAQSYRAVHEALAAALGSPATVAVAGEPEVGGWRVEVGGLLPGKPPTPHLQPPPSTPAPAGVCFERAELFDVIDERTGGKIAGAAQKRNKHGLLFQGSIWKPAAGPVDWEKFHDDFVGRLAAALDAPAVPTPWPEMNEDEIEGLTERYSSPEWMEAR